MVSKNQAGRVLSYRDEAAYLTPVFPEISVLQDSIQDSVRVPSADTLRTGVSPGLPETLSDTLVVVDGDTLLQTRDQTPSPGIADTSDVWQVDDFSRPSESRDITIVREVPAASRTAIIPEQKAEVQGTCYFDASFYLEKGISTSFPGEHPFNPVKEQEAQTAGNPVFPSGQSTLVHNSSGAYRDYLEKDLNQPVETDILYSGALIPALVILSLLLITWIKLIYVRFLTPVLVSAFSHKEASRLYQERNAPAQNAFLILQVIFAINGGVFFLFVAGHFDLRLPDIRPVLLFIVSFSTIFILAGLKTIAIGITGFLFDRQKLFSEYSYNISLFNKIYGLLLLPLIVGLLYGGEIYRASLIYTGLFLAVGIYILQLTRGLAIIMRKGFSLFYLILYLCAFEIVPIIVLYKMFELFLM